MAYEDIAGTRTALTDYVGGTIAAASTTPLLQTLTPMSRAFTLTGIGIGAGTTRPAGTSMNIRVWVNGARKGLATVSLTGGAGAFVSVANNLVFTGPANSVLGLSVASVGGTAGVGARYQVRYHHGWSR